MADHDRPVTTDDAGIPAPSDEHSLRAGAEGPILLQDHYLLQKMAQFNRERTPERVVHAKGAGAHGHFEVTGDVTHWTRADFLSEVGKRTEVFARFSTVAGELGSADTVRDPRGFSLKFYTDEGNYDLVGNNTPIFFVRDPSKFQDFIRSQKRRSDTGRRDNEMQWDFWTLSPESTHQVAYLFGDRGIPATLRHMNGYGSHTFTWVNADGEPVYVKYHLHSDQGVRNLSPDDAQRLAGREPDHHRADLWAAIETGDTPSWTMSVQVMPIEDADDYRFNPFDVTKVWPHGDYPLHEVGRLTLDRNPTDYFTEVEQAAFEPSNMVPGIEPSPDPMLLGRLFSYPDTHRHRIGANYMELPINRPKTSVHSYNKDGHLRHHNPGDPVYAPNSEGGPAARPERFGEEHTGWPVGELRRAELRQHPEDSDTGQARALILEVLDDEARRRMVENIANHATDGVSASMHPRIVDYWRAVDEAFGDAVGDAIETALDADA